MAKHEVEIPGCNDVDLGNLSDEQLLEALDCIQDERDRIQKEIATRLMSRGQQSSASSSRKRF